MVIHKSFMERGVARFRNCPPTIPSARPPKISAGIGFQARLRITVFALALGALVECGGGSSGGGSGPYSTTVPASTVLGQLSADQFATMCSEIDKELVGIRNDPGFKAGQCPFEGYATAGLSFLTARSDADLEAVCATARDQCYAAPPQTTILTCDRPPAADCTVTVGQYITWLNDSQRAIVAQNASVPPCSALTHAGLGPDGGQHIADQATPASCAVMIASCPFAGSLPSPRTP